MATPDITKAPPGQEAGPQLAGANVLPFPHQADGDFFDPVAAEGLDGTLVRNPVVKREEGESSDFKQGTTELEIVTLQNGRHYEVVRGRPKHQRSDIGVFIGTALATSIHGHNEDTALAMMDLGYPVTVVGAEGGHQRWPRTSAEMQLFINNLFSISIGETATNMHEILEELDNDENPHGEIGKTIEAHESRAAAVATGFNALAPEFEREVVYSDLIAPCFPTPRPIRFHPSTIARALEIPVQVGSLARNSVSLDPRQIWRNAKTVDLNPHFMAHVAATIPALISGQAGELAKRISLDARIHHTHFTGDPWTDIPGWMETFVDHPLVVHDLQPGDHGGIARKDTQENRLGRFRNLRDELESAHQRPDRVNWGNVYMGGLALAA